MIETFIDNAFMDLPRIASRIARRLRKVKNQKSYLFLCLNEKCPGLAKFRIKEGDSIVPNYFTIKSDMPKSSGIKCPRCSKIATPASSAEIKPKMLEDLAKGTRSGKVPKELDRILKEMAKDKLSDMEVNILEKSRGR